MPAQGPAGIRAAERYRHLCPGIGVLGGQAQQGQTTPPASNSVDQPWATAWGYLTHGGEVPGTRSIRCAPSSGGAALAIDGSPTEFRPDPAVFRVSGLRLAPAWRSSFVQREPNRFLTG